MAAQNSTDKSTAAFIREKVLRFGDRLWTYSDFPNLPAAAVSQALSRLAKMGVLQRVRKGLYYHPRQTVVGPSRPSSAQIGAELLGSSARPTGVSAANVLGLSTQNPAREAYATAKTHVPVGVTGVAVKARRPPLPRSLTAQDASILEFIRDRGRWSELPAQETIARLQSMLSEPGRFARLAGAAHAEPPRVRAILGAIGATIGADARTLNRLHNSLNPLSKYDFGAFAGLASAKDWRAK